MSYDLFFYKSKNSTLSNQNIRDYLTTNLADNGESNSQWFFENPDTEIYFYFEENKPQTDPELTESFDDFDSFDDTNFTFNINFLRPNFFGIEAFNFVDKFISDLDLFVLDTQSSIDPDYPIKPIQNQLYQNWADNNNSFAASMFKEYNLNYYPLERSNYIWRYNFERKKNQLSLGGEYFVPKIFFFKTVKTNEIISVATWTENIPSVLPNVDYYLVDRKYKFLFKEIKEDGFISSYTLFNIFSDFLDDYDTDGSKIIYLNKTLKTHRIFNNLKLNLDTKSFMERIPADKVVNVIPK